MNKQLLSLSLALPILIIWAGNSLAKKGANQGNLETQSTVEISQVRLKTQQPQPFLISARDEEKKECQWLGICKERS